ncbi:MAG: carbamate kinase [Rhodospirillales bacterium]|nr:carbamate kinase [Rhodospirillales bacterium]
MNANKTLPKRLLVAVGGNAIQPAGAKGTSEEQMEIAASTARALLPLLELDNELIITHGNGPAVGKVLMRNVLARDRVVPMTLDILVADTQGATAYILMQAFENALREVGNPRHVVGLVTQVEVDPDDPGFKNPTKPVGYFYTEEEAKALTEQMGWTMREDAGRGWRLVVASPKPRHVCDISLVDALASRGTVVIAGGGGGIPVVRDSRGVRHGVEAVIDKDLTSAHMANILKIDTLMILTAVSRVAINFGKPDQRDLEEVPVSEMRKYLAEGHFPAGSMGPKIEAAIKFIDGGGKRAIIGHLDEALPALHGEAGTHIVADREG